ncbi:hypothetical protein [Streptantibioticus cattleyicolor]|uniref:Uncharacterized protein n=1 Tax=Streptantibioticus cattleyicolor (strain ATCC 35852 / DSM 46488 / JCM 4925 / NBRC 14057 / NRRL 8057) TaxID=1003195 RepID=F8JMD5_STREN|nr:hypothetical protein [Streptantibioticus cattleyicolor]AEW99384.1 hypothetical protein SCATT_p11910 [Streptantibioticus cattleyicolor NRRL 8057 = DSM 46488]CCB71573.1 protein of unknown function [Streptantibioticus cattleyicolor NRRL 8057 = DSM 46488]
MPPTYDVHAADRLSKELSQLAARLDALIGRRAGRRQALLAAPTSDNWQGGKRRAFEGEFAREQAALKDLLAAARSLKAGVDRATAQARAAHRNGQ